MSPYLHTSTLTKCLKQCSESGSHPSAPLPVAAPQGRSGCVTKSGQVEGKPHGGCLAALCRAGVRQPHRQCCDSGSVPAAPAALTGAGGSASSGAALLSWVAPPALGDASVVPSNQQLAPA